MVKYVIRWDKGKYQYNSSKPLTKAVAKKEVKFLKQMDNDMPLKMRRKWLKTHRAVQVRKK
tara:strand:- start:534 stop:716 length:183 start_codon:yes stop_codon:yes gene_type:complete